MISPIDMPQVVTGLGMQITARYSRILKDDGTEMTTREILAAIHQVYGEILAETTARMRDNSLHPGRGMMGT